MACSVLLLALVAAVGHASEQHETSARNPIRRVVDMLQLMQKKVTEEGRKETALFEKFMCYCKNSGGDLAGSIAAGESKTIQLKSDIKAAEAEKAQLEADLKAHKADRADAKDAVKEATALREKEAAAFATLKGDNTMNIDALTKAIAALEKGMAGGFLQTNTAVVLRKLVLASHKMIDADRQEVLSFLSSTQSNGYAPQAGEITGILKQMKDEFLAELADATAVEEAAIEAYKGLMAAKRKEIAALTKSIENKLVRSGDVSVKIAEMKNDLGDTGESMEEDAKMLANLKGNCEKKAKEWEVVKKTRAEELLALADTIKILNDDDALELFKKTLPSAASSFIQVKETTYSLKTLALAEIRKAQRASRPIRQQLDFIALALSGKKIGFDKVIKMIDDMIAVLGKEQTDDDNKKEYCTVQFDSSDDKKKGLERSVADGEAAIADAEETIATLKAEIKALEAGIASLDKSVADATEQRKEEHEAFKQLIAEDSAAKELINFAKNRLQKFYNPKLYKEAAKRELTKEERITVDMGGTVTTPAPSGIAGTGVTVLAQVSEHNAQVSGHKNSYEPMHEENQGVVQMMDLLCADLDKEMTTAETDEKDNQAEYEQSMADAADKRAADSSSLTDKKAAKADMEAQLEAHTNTKAANERELAATNQFIAALHGECDWLMKYFDARKEARAGEVDALGKAKAVLSGADYSLLQNKVRSLRRQM